MKRSILGLTAQEQLESCDNAEVTVKHGKLRGSFVKNVYDGHYYAFMGVPYAKPPTGPLRFKDPEEPEPWSCVRDATIEGDKCAQVNVNGNIVGSENCLHLNVYTPTLDSSKKLPVMVFFHWGFFIMGSSDVEFYGADYLVRKDVVLVTVNHRIGILGFLTLEDPVAPGNQGLKDLAMALGWVRDNVSQFSGDPDNVTIFGESAGAVCVHLLMSSNLADGLYHKAICQSGVLNCSWVFQPEQGKDMAYKVASSLGLRSTDPKTVVDFLRTVDVRTLIKQQALLYSEENRLTGITPFGPTVDKESRNPIVTMPPKDLKQLSPKVPLLIGYTSHEGIYFSQGKDIEAMRKLKLKFVDLSTKIMREKLAKSGIYADDVTELYGIDEYYTRESIKNYASLLTDVIFVDDINDFVKIQSEKFAHPIYFYKFAHDAEDDSIIKKMFNIELPGCPHGEELQYLFYIKHMKFYGKRAPEPGSVDHRLIDYFTEMWTNFARTGNPTPEIMDTVPIIWRPIEKKSDECCYLHISSDLEMRTMRKASMFPKWLSAAQYSL